MDDRYFFDKETNGIVVLDKNESSHLLKVRRAKINDVVTGFCGDGYDYKLSILTADKNCSLKVIDKVLNTKTEDLSITVCLAYVKNDALTEAVENLTALGVNKIILFSSKYSVAKIDDDKKEKLINVAIQSCKQCERATIPLIEIQKKLDLKTLKGDIFLAYENETNFSKQINLLSNEVNLIIGPEGGFSIEEVEYFKKHNAKLISLGKTILRAPLASVVGVCRLKEHK